MNCKNCYQEISDGSKFCPHCGAKQNEVQPNAEQENAVKNDPVQATGAVKTTENAAGYQDVSGYQNNGGMQQVIRITVAIRMQQDIRITAAIRMQQVIRTTVVIRT